MALNKIDEAAHRPWNPKGSLPVHQWLVQSQSNMDVLDVLRLKACGNIVIPQCATLALSVLAAQLNFKD